MLHLHKTTYSTRKRAPDTAWPGCRGNGLGDATTYSPYLHHRPDGIRLGIRKAPIARCSSENDQSFLHLSLPPLRYAAPRKARLFGAFLTTTSDSGYRVVQFAGYVFIHIITQSRSVVKHLAESLRFWCTFVCDGFQSGLRGQPNTTPALVPSRYLPSARTETHSREQCQSPVYGRTWLSSQENGSFG